MTRLRSIMFDQGFRQDRDFVGSCSAPPCSRLTRKQILLILVLLHSNRTQDIYTVLSIYKILGLLTIITYFNMNSLTPPFILSNMFRSPLTTPGDDCEYHRCRFKTASRVPSCFQLDNLMNSCDNISKCLSNTKLDEFHCRMLSNIPFFLPLFGEFLDISPRQVTSQD